MKKEIVLLVVFVLFSLSIISAQESSAQTQTDSSKSTPTAPVQSAQTASQPPSQTTTEETPPLDKEKFIQNLKQVPKRFNDESNKVLEKEITLFPAVKQIARIMFGLKPTQDINLSQLIILAALWLFVVIVASLSIGFISMFNTAIKWAMGIIIASLAGLTGAYWSVAVFWFNIGDLFKFLESKSAIALFFLLAFLFTIVYAASYLVNILQKQAILAGAERKGIEAGAGVTLARNMYEQAKSG